MIKDWLVLGSVAFSVGFGISLPFTKDVRQSLLAGATTVPAASAGVWAVTQRRKSTIAAAFSALQSEVQTLEHQRQELARSLQATKLQAEQLEADLQTQQNAKQQLEQETTALDSQKRQFKEDTDRLQKWLEELRHQETTLNGSLSQLAVDLEHRQTERRNLQVQVSELELQLSQHNQARQQIDRELADLRRDRERSEADYQSLQAQLRALDAQKQESERALVDLRDRQQNLEVTLQRLQPEVFDLQQQHDTLKQAITALPVQTEEHLSVGSLTQVEEQVEPVADRTTPLLRDRTRLEAPQTVHALELVRQEFSPPTTIADFQLANPEHTRWLWEEVIEPRWLHRPFLGSVSLPKSQTDEIWGSDDIVDIVARNLKQQGENNLDYSRLLERFSDHAQNWLKIYTYVLSEYAYYADGTVGFWQGLCDRFGLSFQSVQQKPVTTLGKLAKEGIHLLQLPTAVGGYPVVSTLWLQNGIPRYNLHHFAKLVAILLEQFSWQEMVEMEPTLLAGELLNLSKQRLPQLTVLKRFLKASCSPETEPLTGMLLRSIANVALVLQEYKLKPEDVLLNAEHREDFLTRLPRSNFFLRDWEAFVEILSVEPRPLRDREVKQSQKPLLLKLDIDDLLIQVVLPAHKLSNPDWGTGTCSILNTDWKGWISETGELKIEDYAETINRLPDGWNWQLLDDQGNGLHEWHLEGITPEFPCLMFDAWTGDRIFANPDIAGSSEILYFTARNAQILASDDIELIESNVPCSITGWHGQRLRLVSQSATLEFKFVNHSVDLRWAAIQHTPTLRGLKSKGNKPKFFSVPTLWYPPNSNSLTVNLNIQNLGKQVCLTKPQEVVPLPPNASWNAIALKQWITEPGNYEVQLKTTEREWTERFEIEAEYHANAEDYAFFGHLEIMDETGQSSPLPIVLQDVNQFWQKTLCITGLWTLENIVLLFRNGEHQTSRTVQADASGCLTLELTTLHDVLPPSSRYAIAYQRMGRPAKPLIELNLETNDVD